jgi:hypothetical protein
MNRPRPAAAAIGPPTEGLAMAPQNRSRKSRNRSKHRRRARGRPFPKGQSGNPAQQFRPGESGNPGGRPKSMASVILKQSPKTSADLVQLWRLIAFGAVSAVQKRYGVKPRLQDRLAAAAELADRLQGRAVQAIEVDDRPMVPAFALPEGCTGVHVHEPDINPIASASTGLHPTGASAARR